MVRGVIVVTCPHCGRTFVAPDIEWGATVLSAPIHCPDCGQLVDPQGWKGLLGIIRGWLLKKGLCVCRPNSMDVTRNR